MKSNKLGLIGICRKAGKLKYGMDAAKSACLSGEAKAVFTASDISEKSLKEVRFNCAKYEVSAYRLSCTMDEISEALGRRVGILAVTDGGFARSLREGVQRLDTDIDEFYSNEI